VQKIRQTVCFPAICIHHVFDKCLKIVFCHCCNG